METVIFSKRLYGMPGMLIFLGLSVSFTISTVRHLQTYGTPQGTSWMVLGLTTFAAVATLGWRYALRRQSIRWMRLYFTFQIIGFLALFWLENADTQNGAGVGNLSIILLLQVCVLSWRARLLVGAVTIIGMIAVSAAFLQPEQIIFPSILISLTSGAVLLIGHIMVSEERARELLNEYTTQVEELATAKERNRLAREIHDNIGHYLTAVNMQIEAARAVMGSNPERAEQSLVKAQTLTKEGLAEVRRSVAALRTNPTENRPLHEAIELLVEEHRASGLNVDFQVEGAIRPCSAQVEITLYRIAQEALTNIRKHARATHADLILNYLNSSQVNLTVQDDGVGSADKGEGFGLVGIQERLKLLGGSIRISTQQGQGFMLRAEIPA